MSKIILVDDEKGVRLSARLVLEDLGHNVIDFSDGESALTHLGENLADLLILDIWMPEPDGIEVLKRLQKSNIDIPVLVITGSHGNMPISATESVVMTYGADDVLYKPFRDEELVVAVQKIIGN